MDFHLKGGENRPYSGYGSRYTGTDGWVHVPAHGRSTIVLHGAFPGRKAARHHHLEGRTVYVLRADAPRFVTKRFAAEHPVRTIAETVPNDPGSLQCDAYYADPD